MTLNNPKMDMPGLSPVAMEAFERLEKQTIDGAPGPWLNKHKVDILVLWREWACSGVAAVVRITPAELDKWRRNADIPLPKPGDMIEGEGEVVRGAIERLISALLPNMQDRWTPWLDANKEDIVEALRGSNKAQLAKALNAPVGTFYCWAATRGLYKMSHRVSESSHAIWVQEHPDEAKDALRQMGSIRGAARALKVPYSSLRDWMGKNDIRIVYDIMEGK